MRTVHSRPARIAALSSFTVARSVSRPCRKRLRGRRGRGRCVEECAASAGQAGANSKADQPARLREEKTEAAPRQAGCRTRPSAAQQSSAGPPVAGGCSPVAPQHLLSAVPCELEERVRGKHDGAVGQRGVRNHKVLQVCGQSSGGQVRRASPNTAPGHARGLPHSRQQCAGASQAQPAGRAGSVPTAQQSNTDRRQRAHRSAKQHRQDIKATQARPPCKKLKSLTDWMRSTVVARSSATRGSAREGLPRDSRTGTLPSASCTAVSTSSTIGLATVSFSLHAGGGSRRSGSAAHQLHATLHEAPPLRRTRQPGPSRPRQERICRLPARGVPPGQLPSAACWPSCAHHTPASGPNPCAAAAARPPPPPPPPHLSS